MIRPSTLAAILAASSLGGCSPGDGPGLVVATTWHRSARDDLASAFRREGVSIAWILLGPGDSPSALLDGRNRPDMILGVPEPALARLADAGRLALPEAEGQPPWRLVLRPHQDEKNDPGPAFPFYSDPRDDPSTLAEARSVLEADGWADGYRNLARRAAPARPIPGRSSGPISALSRPGATTAPTPFEAVAILRDPRKGDEARRFLKLLEGLDLIRDPAVGALEVARGDGMLADLLGAALVDAHGELRSAEIAVRRSSRPEAADAAFGDRPPWPPASVAKLQSGPSDRSLVESLAEQVAPDPEAKAWLLASWSSPRRPIDGAVLAELAGAVDGRLAREPRFRAWLRAEWAAWHRQLYRRVARVAGGYVPS